MNKILQFFQKESCTLCAIWHCFLMLSSEAFTGLTGFAAHFVPSGTASWCCRAKLLLALLALLHTLCHLALLAKSTSPENWVALFGPADPRPKPTQSFSLAGENPCKRPGHILRYCTMNAWISIQTFLFRFAFWYYQSYSQNVLFLAVPSNVCWNIRATAACRAHPAVLNNWIHTAGTVSWPCGVTWFTGLVWCQKTWLWSSWAT